MFIVQCNKLQINCNKSYKDAFLKVFSMYIHIKVCFSNHSFYLIFESEVCVRQAILYLFICF